MDGYRVLHFPQNTASLASMNNAALKQIGVDSEAYVRQLYANISIVSNEGVTVLPFDRITYSPWMPHFFPLFDSQYARAVIGSMSTPGLLSVVRFVRIWSVEFFKRLLRHLPGGRRFVLSRRIASIPAALGKLAFFDDIDILHDYTGDLMGEVVEDLVRYGKLPGVVGWQGSEIRIPEVELATNPYYAEVLDKNGASVYGSYELSKRLQDRCYGLGFEPVVTAGMRQYLLPEYVGPVHQIFHPVELPPDPIYPKVATKKPRVVHAPSAAKIKGTAHVRAAVEALRADHEFEYFEVSGMERPEVLNLMRSCDIYIDQLILGDHGMAALEAMAQGKPVICYLKPSVSELLPPDIPIVNANPDTITEVLGALLEDAPRRHELGIASRAYVERYHDPEKTARRLDEIYRDVLSRKHKDPRFRTVGDLIPVIKEEIIRSEA